MTDYGEWGSISPQGCCRSKADAQHIEEEDLDGEKTDLDGEKADLAGTNTMSSTGGPKPKRTKKKMLAHKITGSGE